MGLWLASEPLVLASQSKVRRALLEAAGIPVEARPAHLDERAIEQGVRGGPADVALTLAREKARTVAAMSDRPLVVGCDQTLALGERGFSKPKNRDAAREQLLALRGKMSAEQIKTAEDLLHQHREFRASRGSAVDP